MLVLFMAWFFCFVICFSYFLLLLAEGGKYTSHLLQAFYFYSHVNAIEC